jgi:hypothetical protein
MDHFAGLDVSDIAHNAVGMSVSCHQQATSRLRRVVAQ